MSRCSCFTWSGRRSKQGRFLTCFFDSLHLPLPSRIHTEHTHILFLCLFLSFLTHGLSAGRCHMHRLEAEYLLVSSALDSPTRMTRCKSSYVYFRLTLPLFTLLYKYCMLQGIDPQNRISRRFAPITHCLAYFPLSCLILMTPTVILILPFSLVQGSCLHPLVLTIHLRVDLETTPVDR